MARKARNLLEAKISAENLELPRREKPGQNPSLAVATHRAQAQRNARGRGYGEGWIRLSIAHSARTYSLIPEVTKQLEKLEALSERLGSERNGGGTKRNKGLGGRVNPV
jgi:hypothetical protein